MHCIALPQVYMSLALSIVQHQKWLWLNTRVAALGRALTIIRAELFLPVPILGIGVFKVWEVLGLLTTSTRCSAGNVLFSRRLIVNSELVRRGRYGPGMGVCVRVCVVVPNG